MVRGGPRVEIGGKTLVHATHTGRRTTEELMFMGPPKEVRTVEPDRFCGEDMSGVEQVHDERENRRDTYEEKLWSVDDGGVDGLLARLRGNAQDVRGGQRSRFWRSGSTKKGVWMQPRVVGTAVEL